MTASAPEKRELNKSSYSFCAGESFGKRLEELRIALGYRSHSAAIRAVVQEALEARNL